MEFEQAKEIINKSKSIYIVAHVNPDGDAIGSTYGMYFAMKKLNKDVHVIMPEYSDVFKFLPDITKICEKDIYVENYDLLINMSYLQEVLGNFELASYLKNKADKNMR